ncbi:cysteine-rich venom protein latisemin-like [Plakobranchus ocellatus]|uniref:Cysteine-rich venom protein latisemin-like n=1 Tax=Plakobranchus ocellatus TaxID=259542 RepID=A0AAV4D2E2_9GAST|nr:cysteine-rich venom protein latisemin-like [Plakobranchus ocellatus]
MLARKWAEACDLEQGRLHHDHVRDIPGRFSVGQNIGTGYKNFTEAIEAWFAEKDNYRPLFGTSVRTVGGAKPIGHYTQLVWAATNRVGCAVAKCSGLTFHVCNYAPMGNFVPFKSPYTTGPQKCSACNKCVAGLCDCGDLTCENFGRFNVSTCQCECKYKQYHVGPTCKLSCNYPKDMYFCGTQSSFYQSDCGIAYTSSACPKMCEVCPCSDSSSVSAKPCRASSQGKDSDSGSACLRQSQLLYWTSALVIAMWILQQAVLPYNVRIHS